MKKGDKRNSEFKRNVKIVGFIFIFIMLSVANTYSLFKVLPKETRITGHGITASVSFVIQDSNRIINITSPLNQTYNFNIGDIYTLDLNASANFEAESWWYTLWDNRHNELVYFQNPFVPNITFDATRWSNTLIVYANDSRGEIYNTNVTFFIEVPNSAPFLGDINSSIFVCENDYLEYKFNATDVDENNLLVGITPTNPFYSIFSSEINYTTNEYEIFSGNLGKIDVGGINNGYFTYEETVFANDGEYIDTRDTNITVIEINNPPVIQNIGVQTVWTYGANSIFYQEVNVSDIEDGNQTSENITFSIIFENNENLFEINQNGIMNYTPNSSSIGTYLINVCVNDTGIDNPHENISDQCGQTGGVMMSCENFSLTITDENRPPTITEYSPSNLTITSRGTNRLYFNVSEYDPDYTIPDTYWYVDDELTEYDEANSTDEFFYTFGCGIRGSHKIRADVTDGLLNDTIEWDINVELVDCPEEEVGSGGGGGGGGGGLSCTEKWGCGLWGICQNAKSALGLGTISGEDYREIRKECDSRGLDENSCGIKTRICTDTNKCNTTYNMPEIFQSCVYVGVPSCYDGILNCHDGSCELSIDCGGPCDPCPTCSDGIQNQGEEGIDCGGPCAWKCPEPEPLLKRTKTLYITGGVLGVLIIILIITIRRILKYKKYFK